MRRCELFAIVAALAHGNQESDWRRYLGQMHSSMHACGFSFAERIEHVPSHITDSFLKYARLDPCAFLRSLQQLNAANFTTDASYEPLQAMK